MNRSSVLTSVSPSVRAVYLYRRIPKDIFHDPILQNSNTFLVSFCGSKMTFLLNHKEMACCLFLRCLRPLCAVLGAGLLPVGNACRVKGTTDNVISCTRQILHPAAADQNNAVLLQIVPFAGDIARYLDSIGKTYSGDLSQRRIRLLGGSGLHSGAHAALLRSGCVRSRLVQRVIPFLQCRRGRLLCGSLTSFSY